MNFDFLLAKTKKSEPLDWRRELRIECHCFDPRKRANDRDADRDPTKARVFKKIALYFTMLNSNCKEAVRQRTGPTKLSEKQQHFET